MKIALSSLLIWVFVAPTQASPLCNNLIDRVLTRVDRSFPFQCECGLRLFRRIRFNCDTRVCLDSADGLLDTVFPVTLPINNPETTCLTPSFKGRFPKLSERSIDVGGCTGSTTMEIDIDRLVKE